jgi:cytochrome c
VSAAIKAYYHEGLAGSRDLLVKIIHIFTAVIFFTTLANASDEVPQAFSQCHNCHTTMKAGQYRVAPPLNGIVGRPIASVPGYKYSDALKARSDEVWTKAALNKFLKRPNHALPGTKMYFRGIPNAFERVKLINWLASHTVPSVIPPRNSRRPVKQQGIEERTKALFHPCTACHSYTDGAPSKIGPNLFGVYGRPVASYPDFDYSMALRHRGGVWNADTLNVFFVEHKKFAQGSHMAFLRLAETEDRALLIKFLKTLSR